MSHRRNVVAFDININGKPLLNGRIFLIIFIAISHHKSSKNRDLRK